MQDEINEKVIVLSIRGAKLTGQALQKALKFLLSQIEKELKGLNKQAIPPREAEPKTAHAS